MPHRKGCWSGLWTLLLLGLLSCSTPPRQATPAASAVGLNAQFFTNSNLSGPALARLAVSAKVPGLRPGPFSARYEGTLLAPKDGEYTLHMVGQGQARLFLDGRLVSNELPVSVRLRLQAGQPVGLRLEYQAPPGAARLRLDWEGPGLAAADP